MGDGHYLKLTAQQSRRLNTADQVYVASVNGNVPESESMSGLELAYSAHGRTGVSLDLATFFNRGDVIAWDNGTNRSTDVGHLGLIGLEAAAGYRWDNGLLSTSYSHLKQVHWELAPGVTRSGISYADYNATVGGNGAVIQGYGNDVNNWPNQSLKLIFRNSFFDRLTLHADTRLLWDFQGAKNGLTALYNAVQGFPEEAVVEQALLVVDAYDVYDFDFRFNASVAYQVLEDLNVTVFSQNLMGSNGNKRYSYDYGNNKAAPKRVRYVEEPRSFGLSLRYAF
jgi:hypothetical protein